MYLRRVLCYANVSIMSPEQYIAGITNCLHIPSREVACDRPRNGGLLRHTKYSGHFGQIEEENE